MPLGAPSLRILGVVTVVLAALYFGVLAWLYVAQRNLLYPADKIVFEPSALGLDAEVRHIKTADGETLLAWWFAPKPGRPFILYFRGSAHGLDTRAERFKQLVAGGDGLLAIQYRGYAGSTGHPTEAGLLLDGEAAYAAALSSGMEPKRLVAMGESPARASQSRWPPTTGSGRSRSICRTRRSLTWRPGAIGCFPFGSSSGTVSAAICASARCTHHCSSFTARLMMTCQRILASNCSRWRTSQSVSSRSKAHATWLLANACRNARLDRRDPRQLSRRTPKPRTADLHREAEIGSIAWPLRAHGILGRPRRWICSANYELGQGPHACGASARERARCGGTLPTPSQ